MNNDDKNQNITGLEKDEMHNAGVDLTVSGNEENEQEVLDVDSTGDSSVDLANMGINLSPKEEIKNNQTTAIKETPNTQNQNPVTLGASELEKEFKSAVSTTTDNVSSDQNFAQKITGLKSLLLKIKEKLGLKKTEVKEELENLKKIKEDISKDIEDIKELEESEQKIETELKKIESIKEEISSIEKEVNQELNS